MSAPYPVEMYPGCPCYACDSLTWREIVPGVTMRTRMSLCPTCGYKRCPAAANHVNECSGSNESGQPGSLYPKVAHPEGWDKWTQQQRVNWLVGRLAASAKP